MRISQSIIDIINIFDEVLLEINACDLFSNDEFSIDAMSSYDWVKFNFNGNQIKASVSITFTDNDVTISILNNFEAFQFVNDYIVKNKIKFKNLIKYILTSFILVDCYGDFKFIARFFDSNGECVYLIEDTNIFSLNRKHKIRLYMPIYKI